MISREGVAQGLLWICLAFISYLALTPQPDAPGLGWDKLNHVAAFLVLALLAELGWPGRGRLYWRIGLLLAYGAVLELVQAGLAHREGSMPDLIADGVGLLLYQVLRRPWLR
jgi:VanZ family protein